MKNKKILYFHGLGGGEEPFLQSYSNLAGFDFIQYPTIFDKEWKIDRGESYFNRLMQIKADVVLGISFGGYVAYHYAKAKGLPCYLINPALDRDLSRTGIGWMNFNYEPKESPLTVFLGEKDDVVPNHYTINYLRDSNASIYRLKWMRHSPNFDEWLTIWNFIKNEQSNKKMNHEVIRGESWNKKGH